MISTEVRTDPMRNFKFQVDIRNTQVGSSDKLAQMGFTNVAGINMTTEVIPYREGGWNTNYHKLPGQTDFGPLTLTQGIMWTNKSMWQLAQNMFSAQWGAGHIVVKDASTLATTPFRFDTVIRVLDHPITGGAASGAPQGSNTKPHEGARLAFFFVNCWVGSVAFNDLDASGNAVLISQMTMHHEGFDVLFGTDAVNA